MERLLIATGMQALSAGIQKRLTGQFQIESCTCGQDALSLLRRFQPDILFLDMQLPGVDNYGVLHVLRTAGCSVSVIAMSAILDECACMQMASLGARVLLPKPCSLGYAVAQIRQLAFQRGLSDSQEWCLENEMEWIFADLGFGMARERYLCVCDAVLMKYADPRCSMTKSIYLEIARKNSSTVQQVEKAIRDAISAARKTGNVDVWGLYFPVGADGRVPCPSNEIFVCRVAAALRQRSRLKLPYPPEEKAI